ncbi:MAG: hypothetical protein KGJ90_06240 [Patescibacteria group bacterium]|nr:hypothetical protein [Patescibacteria group bacterium]
MQLHDIIKSIQNFFHSLVSSLKPALDLVESKGGQEILALAESVLASFAEGTPWATIVAALIPAAKSAGKDLLIEEAGVILNLAKANLLAKQVAAMPPAPSAS